MDRFLLPGRDGIALPHLRGQLQNSAERIHRARPIWSGVCFPGASDADRVIFDCVARETKEALIMVNVIDVSRTMPQQAPPQTHQPGADETEALETMIDVCDVDFAYGGNPVLHKVSLEMPARAV